MACQYAQRATLDFNHPSFELCLPYELVDLGLDAFPHVLQTSQPRQPSHIQHSGNSNDSIQPSHPSHPMQKRPRVTTPEKADRHKREENAGVNINDHIGNETMALKYIALFAKWVRGLRQAHCNCLNIPVSLVIKMGIRMVHHLVLKQGLKMKNEILATTFWVALKFYSSRDTIPNASFMSLVTDVPKKALLSNEPKVLAHLGWDLYVFYKE